ncbi:molecular chaperone HtpG [Ileibacterium valens]|uniref:molecular chaperone HtpG n=1 Tax=Ileibacterium valens TaxID=1862668 RepID=UPI00259B4564|nr:molecular chaperone HtpG [Ileibacterium valens]
MAEIKEFKAESKRLLDMMIHSIYTHKEIFLRELISNASDAIDKYYLYALQNGQTPADLGIRIDLDETNRTLTISDNGIGMDEEELEDNLGTIAKSGSSAFKEEMKKKEEAENKEIDIIGQFGVGFYSAFMVADEVIVLSRKAGSEQAYCWKSDGINGYTLEPAEKEGRGTTIILKLKADDDMESYSEYLNSYMISDLVKKYSDYIRYPISMDVETQKMVEGTEDKETPEFETVKESKVLNSMTPLWKKPKSEITQEQFDQFYKEHFVDYRNPLETIFFKVEGNTSFTALLYIPSAIPQGFYTREYKPGLQLYSKGVFIENDCEELLPGYLRFVKGLVDSQDLSLNVSREMLQHDHQLRVIRNRIEKKVLSELSGLLKTDREKYEKFWKNFGLDLKFGVYNAMGRDNEKLENLLLFHSSAEKKPVTLEEYVSSMPEDQKDIYYISGQSIDVMDKMPIVNRLKSKGFQVLLLTEEVDEFVLQTIGAYKEHPFKNAAQGDLDLDTEEEKEALKNQNEEHKELLEFMKESIPGVSQVRLSNRLQDDPVMLVAGEGLSFEMEKVFQTMAAQSGEEMPPMKADRILEINPNNKIWNVLRTEYAVDKNRVKEISQVLYDQACLIEGFPIEDPIEYSRKVVALLSDLNE